MEKNPIELLNAAVRVTDLSIQMGEQVSPLSAPSFEQLMMRQLSLQTQMAQVTMSLLLSLAFDMRRIADGQQ